MSLEVGAEESSSRVSQSSGVLVAAFELRFQGGDSMYLLSEEEMDSVPWPALFLEAVAFLAFSSFQCSVR